MEKSLLVSQCVRQLDPSTTTNQDQPSILGLNPQQVIEFMPSEKVNNKKKVRKKMQFILDSNRASLGTLQIFWFNNARMNVFTPSQLYLYQNAQRMKQALPREVEKYLKKKCFGLLSYCQPECGKVSNCSSLCSFTPTTLRSHLWTPVLTLLSFLESESDGLKNTKLSHLSAQLDKDKKRAESLKEVCRENTVLLQRQTRLYLCVRKLYFSDLFETCTQTL